MLLSVSGRPRLIYWTHPFDASALISLPLSSFATFGLLFVVTFNCHKHKAELIYNLVCGVDYTAFGLGKLKRKKILSVCKVSDIYWWLKLKNCSKSFLVAAISLIHCNQRHYSFCHGQGRLCMASAKVAVILWYTARLSKHLGSCVSWFGAASTVTCVLCRTNVVQKSIYIQALT